jgi:GTPase SAR1 family protein
MFAGEPGVGKSAILKRITLNVFDQRYLSTKGVQVWQKTYNTLGVQFYLWEIQGRHMPDKIFEAYAGNADAYVLVSDLGRRQTFSSIEFYWCERIDCKKPVIVLGNKTDIVRNLVTQAKAVMRLEHKLRARGVNVCYSTVVSARTGYRINKILEKVGEACLKCS